VKYPNWQDLVVTHGRWLQKDKVENNLTFGIIEGNIDFEGCHHRQVTTDRMRWTVRMSKLRS